jgi:hypothetical protein
MIPVHWNCLFVGLGIMFTKIPPEFAAPSPHRPIKELNQRAVRVTSIRDWSRLSALYFWLSDTEVLFFRTYKDAEEEERFRAYKRNLKTGEDQDLKQFNTLFDEDAIRKSWITLSPDRRKLAWIVLTDTLYSAALDGTSQVHKMALGIGEPMWWSDNSRWFRMGRWGDDLTHDYGVFLDSNPETWGTTIPFSDNLRYHAACHFTLSPRNTLFIIEPPFCVDRPAITEVSITEISLDNPVRYLRRFPFRLPAKTELYTLSISPSCDRVAWACWSTQKPRRYELWMSNIDGSNMQPLGYVVREKTRAKENDFDWYPNYIQWLPDGKSLSYIHEGALWKVQIVPER